MPGGGVVVVSDLLKRFFGRGVLGSTPELSVEVVDAGGKRSSVVSENSPERPEGRRTVIA